MLLALPFVYLDFNGCSIVHLFWLTLLCDASSFAFYVNLTLAPHPFISDPIFAVLLTLLGSWQGAESLWLTHNLILKGKLYLH